MTFEEILPEVKKGAKVIREGWSGFVPLLLIFRSKLATKDFLVLPQLFAISWQMTGSL